MTAGIGRFVILSALAHASLLLGWQPPDVLDPRYAGGQPLQLALRPPVPATPPARPSAADPIPAEPSKRTRGEAARLERPRAAPRTDAPSPPPAKTATDTPAPAAGPSVEQQESADRDSEQVAVARAEPAEAPLLSEHEVTDRVRAAFATHFRYPRLARRKGWEGRLRVGLHVGADGRLSRIQLLESSGYRVLDQAALRSLERLPAIADAGERIHRRGMDIVLPIEYRLVDA